MLLKAALLMLMVWCLGVLGVYDAGALLHLLLLVGLMLLLAALKDRDAAARQAGDARADKR